jgi:hypothetical protein
MNLKQLNETSPRQILERSTKSGLGPGHLGVVMARAGVGKTALLVQIGLEEALREHSVLHIALGQELEHIHSWYDALFYDFATTTGLENRETVRASVNSHRLIHAYTDAKRPHERLDELVQLYGERLDFEPKTILIDGYDWEQGTLVRRAAEIGAFKIVAKRLGAELWIAAQTHREVTTAHPTELTPPCDDFDELVDLAVFLEPKGAYVRVRLLKDHDNPVPEDINLQLHTDTMRLVSDEGGKNGLCLPARAFTLLSGGAKGSEAAFGAAAERWGLNEVNFSFPGRETERKRGVVELTNEELERGAVSKAFMKAQLHRSFPQTDKFQQLLKSIWHQVATASQVFVIGEIQEDNTVKGGTGWAAELARHFRKPMYVFDQSKNSWFEWSAGTWKPVDSPHIVKTRFAGTGTRFISESGQKAIAELFERSFGPPPK